MGYLPTERSSTGLRFFCVPAGADTASRKVTLKTLKTPKDPKDVKDLKDVKDSKDYKELKNFKEIMPLRYRGLRNRGYWPGVAANRGSGFAYFFRIS